MSLMKKLLKRLMMRENLSNTNKGWNNNYVIRFMAGTLEMEENDIDVAYECIKEKSERM